MNRPSWIALGLVACGPNLPPPGGTSVGNPGKVGYRIAPPTEIEVATATLQGVTTDLLGCDGSRASVLAGDDEDALTGDRVPMPPGTWCGLTLAIDVVSVEGTFGLEGTPASITLEPPTVLTLWMAEPVVVDETEYVLEVGEPGWVTSTQLPPEGDLIGTISPGDAIAPLLLQNLATGTGLYLDADGDGQMSEAERQEGTLASATWLPPAELGAVKDTGGVGSVAVEGCGNCQTGGSPVGGALAGLLALIARRRRAPIS
jgi:MYXO-CTERM domain-containing protein